MRVHVEWIQKNIPFQLHFSHFRASSPEPLSWRTCFFWEEGGGQRPVGLSVGSGHVVSIADPGAKDRAPNSIGRIAIEEARNAVAFFPSQFVTVV